MMKKLTILGILLIAFSAQATQPTVKSMAHATYMCGEKGLIIKTTGLTATLDDDDGYTMYESLNQPASGNLPSYVTVSYGGKDKESNWFSLTLTKQTEFIALTYVNKVKGIQLVGMSCQIVE